LRFYIKFGLIYISDHRILLFTTLIRTLHPKNSKKQLKYIILQSGKYRLKRIIISEKINECIGKLNIFLILFSTKLTYLH